MKLNRQEELNRAEHRAGIRRRAMRARGTAICSLGAIVLFGSVSLSSATMVLGPFRPRPVLTVYLVVDKAPVNVHLDMRCIDRSKGGDRIMVRAFDPEEKLSFWQYEESGKILNSTQLGDDEVQGVAAQKNDKPLEGGIIMGSDLILTTPGVHQLRIVAGAGNSEVTLSLSHDLQYGVSFQNGSFTGWKGQPTRLYAYIPPHAEELMLAGGPGRVEDKKGNLLARMRTTSLTETITIPVVETKTVWSFDMPPPVVPWEMRAAGFPLILCSTEEAANTIHASVETLPDGTVVCHKFQRRIAELLPELLAPEKVGRTEDLLIPLENFKEAWLVNPERNYSLLDTFSLMSGVAWALTNQNLETHGHWSGALGGWQEFVDRPAPENRWDRLKSVKGLYAGASSKQSGAEFLAQAALLNAPFNPYFGKKELLNRAAAAALRDLMVLGEDEVCRGVVADMSPYPGMMAFPAMAKIFPVYRMTVSAMPENVREIWTEAVQRIEDRLYPESLVSCRNQSSHFLVAFQDFAEGSKIPRYMGLARSFAQRFADGQSPAGYHMEEFGPDASYTGITHWHMGIYYQQSKDPVILESLRKSYRFFNHTVAPEPDGTLLGGFNFNHRIAKGFDKEQYRGAKGLVEDVLPEVGLWSPNPDEKAAASKVSVALENLPKAPALNLSSSRYIYWAEPDRTGIWPAKEQKPFIRDFGGEMVAVKRPAYYAVVYVGKPALDPFYIKGREKLRQPSDLENQGGRGGDQRGYGVSPFLGGGLSLFWTPSYGSALLAANWSPSTHHGLVASKTDGARYWEDYFETTYDLNGESGELTCKGKIESVPLRYTRHYQFSDDEIIITLNLRAESDVILSALHENIPVASGIVKAQGAALSQQPGYLKIIDKTGQGVALTLDHPRSVSIQPNGLQRDGLQIARAEIDLPVVWKAGDTHTLIYHLKPIVKDDNK